MKGIAVIDPKTGKDQWLYEDGRIHHSLKHGEGKRHSRPVQWLDCPSGAS